MDYVNNSAVQGTYIPAQHFEGRKLGYVFTKGAHGLGYYMDAAQAVRRSLLLCDMTCPVVVELRVRNYNSVASASVSHQQ